MYDLGEDANASLRHISEMAMRELIHELRRAHEKRKLEEERAQKVAEKRVKATTPVEVSAESAEEELDAWISLQCDSVEIRNEWLKYAKDLGIDCEKVQQPTFGKNPDKPIWHMTMTVDGLEKLQAHAIKDFEAMEVPEASTLASAIQRSIARADLGVSAEQALNISIPKHDREVAAR